MFYVCQESVSDEGQVSKNHPVKEEPSQVNSLKQNANAAV
jgi:hypothetical protein